MDEVTISQDCADALKWQRQKQIDDAKRIGQDIEYTRILAQEKIQRATDSKGRLF